MLKTCRRLESFPATLKPTQEKNLKSNSPDKHLLPPIHFTTSESLSIYNILKPKVFGPNKNLLERFRAPPNRLTSTDVGLEKRNLVAYNPQRYLNIHQWENST